MDNGIGWVGAKIVQMAQRSLLLNYLLLFYEDRKTSAATGFPRILLRAQKTCRSRNLVLIGPITLFSGTPAVSKYPDFGTMYMVYHTESTITARFPTYMPAVAPVSYCN